MLFTDCYGSSAEIGVVDADFGEGVVHWPLDGFRSVGDFGVDSIEEGREVELVRGFFNEIGDEEPSGAASHWESIVHPFWSEGDSMRGVGDDVFDEPFDNAGVVGAADEGVEVFFGE